VRAVGSFSWIGERGGEGHIGPGHCGECEQRNHPPRMSVLLYQPKCRSFATKDSTRSKGQPSRSSCYVIGGRVHGEDVFARTSLTGSPRNENPTHKKREHFFLRASSVSPSYLAFRPISGVLLACKRSVVAVTCGAPRWKEYVGVCRHHHPSHPITSHPIPSFSTGSALLPRRPLCSTVLLAWKPPHFESLPKDCIHARQNFRCVAVTICLIRPLLSGEKYDQLPTHFIFRHRKAGLFAWFSCILMHGSMHGPNFQRNASHELERLTRNGPRPGPIRIHVARLN
jgi:hypothetical protein